MNNIKKYLDEKGQKQSWLALEVGLTQPIISQIVNGQRGVKIPEGHKIADALKKEFDEVFPKGE